PLLQPIVLLVLVGLVLGLVFFFTGMTLQLAIVAYIVVGVTIVVAGIDMIKALRSGHWGLDILAIIAMVATLAVEEYLAGLIIDMMLTGGEALEDRAVSRASQKLDTIINQRPTFANMLDEEVVSVHQVYIDNVLLEDYLF